MALLQDGADQCAFMADDGDALLGQGEQESGFGHARFAVGVVVAYGALTDITEALLVELGVDHYAIYVQDYGAPIGWRLALRSPEALTAVITQNGNAYEDGFVPRFWAPVWAYAKDPGPETEPPVRAALGLDAIRWQYLHGVDRPELVDPDTWTFDHRDMSRPGNALAQLALFRDYVTNPPPYPWVHSYFRQSRVPLLAVWGAEDLVFGPEGARAFARDLPDAEIHLVPGGGHFLLENHLDTAVGHIRDFLTRTLAMTRAEEGVLPRVRQQGG